MPEAFRLPTHGFAVLTYLKTELGVPLAGSADERGFHWNHVAFAVDWVAEFKPGQKIVPAMMPPPSHNALVLAFCGKRIVRLYSWHTPLVNGLVRPERDLWQIAESGAALNGEAAQ